MLSTGHRSHSSISISSVNLAFACCGTFPSWLGWWLEVFEGMKTYQEINILTNTLFTYTFIIWTHAEIAAPKYKYSDNKFASDYYQTNDSLLQLHSTFLVFTVCDVSWQELAFFRRMLRLRCICHSCIWLQQR